MSTFNGIVKEFPDIRIDFFRQMSPPSRPPLACFLSHVHSDHLAGLDTFKSPFVYCSPATREILLRLEKYPHRMNFAKGILEARQQTYKHLRSLLKPIPLETPTEIELSPGKSIRVTLLDANHCVGAVCFLIEGSGQAILYTGDIRSESWWVSSLCRNPILLPYVSSSRNHGKQLKRLDCIYLDTTFAVKDDMYMKFPLKAEGLSELLCAVSKYPKDTCFYFDAWTFGYEDVWQALAAFLGSKVHVDAYRYRLYLGLANGGEPKAPEAAKLMGFRFGNYYQNGCLTSQPALLHSCEKGTGCDIRREDFVRITPIISRHDGVDIAEAGAGGGSSDFNQRHELDISDAALVGQLIALCASKLKDQPQLLARVMEMLTKLVQEQATSISLDDTNLTTTFGQAEEAEDVEACDNIEDVPLERLVPIIAKLVKKQRSTEGKPLAVATPLRSDGLPKQITFPYSRHSSYSELCELIDAFQPRDIHPCTVDFARWTFEHSMTSLFGHVYARPPCFTHDREMLRTRSVALRSENTSVAQSPTQNRQHQERSEPKGAYESTARRSQERKRRRTSCDHSSPPRALHRPSDVNPRNDGSLTMWGNMLSRPAGPLSPEPKPSTCKWTRGGVEKRKPVIGTPEYGRLSPLTGNVHNRRNSTGDHATAVKADRAEIGPGANFDGACELHQLSGHAAAPLQVPEHTGQHALRCASESSPPPREVPVTVKVGNDILTPEAIRRARRQEFYDAALNEGGMWSQVALISTGGGHQIKEEEL